MTDELVSAVGRSFEKAKEKLLLLYTTLDVSLLDPFKFTRGGVMMDEEEMAPLETEPHNSTARACC